MYSLQIRILASQLFIPDDFYTFLPVIRSINKTNQFFVVVCDSDDPESFCAKPEVPFTGLFNIFLGGM